MNYIQKLNAVIDKKVQLNGDNNERMLRALLRVANKTYSAGYTYLSENHTITEVKLPPEMIELNNNINKLKEALEQIKNVNDSYKNKR